MIHFASPLAQYRANKSSIDAAIATVLENGNYILGNQVASFEEEFAEYCACEHAIGVGSGTDALILALRASGVSPGSEVVTVSHTAVATVAAVLAAGAVPVLIDVDPTYYTIDPSALDTALSPRTKAIIAVHLYGQAADLDPLVAFAKRHQLVLIEDCAQSTGGSYRGQRLGSVGDVGCFSFYPTKNLGAIGDGGAIVTSNADIAAAARRLRQYGWDEKRNTKGIGINSRLDEIQAAILRAKLPQLTSDNDRRAALAARYSSGLAGLDVVTPAVRPDTRHPFHLYVIQTARRNALRTFLSRSEIGTAIHYPAAVHQQEGYSALLRRSGALATTERLTDRILSLPLYPELSDHEVDEVIDAIRSFFERER
jgi:dTDP-4-amino-4,6-dideoxygalactose transaminase